MHPFTNLFSQNIHELKYRTEGESFEESTARIADTLADNPEHFEATKEILRDLRFLPGGRVQAAVGAPRIVTPYNCFVSDVIEDSMESIMRAATEAAMTMRLGGGIGYDFSRIRPRGERIVTLDSKASGPVSFMRIFDAVCKTIASSGHRRGAQMAVLRVDHPDIEEFIHCKQNSTELTAFNISVGVTDEFMKAIKEDLPFELKFEGKVFKTVSATALWNDIMRSTWDWAEPGVLFIDRINQMNNLWYCENIEATNPCGEQPLPPNGACLLGSFNLTKYVIERERWDLVQLKDDIHHIVRAMDNVIDIAVYPNEKQAKEAKDKRRMGLGVTGLANAIESMGIAYGSDLFLVKMRQILKFFTNACYQESAKLAKEKGAFPLYEPSKYRQSQFIGNLNPSVQYLIKLYGIRNSHLTSIAPTGTISLAANNVSSGVEPTFAEIQHRIVELWDGPVQVILKDYGVDQYGISPLTADRVRAETHIDVLCEAQKWMDSSVSKTCNVGDDVSWKEFKNLYMQAFEGGAKGCTTFRASGKRMGILKDAVKEPEGGACYIDPNTGIRTCED